MDNENWKGKILLQGFDKEEIERIKKIIDKYERRLGRFSYKEIKLTLQRHKKGSGEDRIFLNEIKGLMKLERNLVYAETTSHEFFSAVEKVMEKLEKETKHLMKLEWRRRGRLR